MTTAPLPSNQSVDLVNGIIDALAQGGVDAAEAFITSLNPALFGEPIVAFFLDKGVAWLASLLEEVTIRDATAIVVDIQANGEQSQVVQSGAALAFANASGDQVAIDKAKQNLVTAYGNLVRFDGVASN